MGRIRWSVSLYSLLGILVPLVIGMGAAARVADSDPRSSGLEVLDAVILAVMAVVLVVSVLRRVRVGDAGISVQPGLLRLGWDDIERFEVRPGMGAALAVRRRDGKTRALTTYGIKRARATAIADRLNEELSASRSG